MPEGQTEASVPPFTLKEWEEIVFRSVAAWEARKREYTRWVAIGVTSAVALSGIFFERLPQAELGRNVGLSLLLLVLLTYILQHLGAEVLEGRINSALRIILAAEEVPDSPWTALKALFKIVELNARQLVKSPVSGSIAVTLIVSLEAANLWPQTLSTPLLILGAWRFTAMLLFSVFLLNLRSSAQGLLPRKEELLETAPRAYPPGERLKREKAATVFALLPIGYYLCQLVLLGWAITSAVPLTYGLVQLVLPLIGLAVIAAWINDVAWPLVKRSSDIFGKLRDLHFRIVTGRAATPGEVFANLKALEQQIEKTWEE
jgi:hypothetical protein